MTNEVRVIRNPFNGFDLRYADLIFKGNPLSTEEISFLLFVGAPVVDVSVYEWGRLR